MKRKKRTLDIRKDITTRNYKRTHWFWYFIYFLVMYCFVGKKYKPHYKKEVNIKDCKTGCFLIWNHLSRLDHIYAMGITYPKRINIVCAYSEFFRSHLHWVFKKNNIIPKKQYTNDLLTIKTISKIIRKKGIVAMAPEGMASHYGTNQPIVPGTAHLFKHYKVPVYFMELRGQYLTNHKTCLDERQGETYATLKLLFSVEDIERMSEQEMEDKINLAFKNDEYEWQKERHIKWNTRGRVCHNMHTLLYKCPACGAENMMAEKDYIKCNSCGNGATLDDYYEFHPYEGSIIPESVSKWAIWERSQIIKEIRENPNYTFKEHVKLGMLPNDHYLKDYKTTEVVGEGEVTIDHSGLHFVGTRNNEPFSFDKPYKELYTLIPMIDLTFLGTYYNNEYYEFFPDHPVCGKMLLLVEEMHRLHVNYWKNFPWMDYLYEPYKNNNELE